MKYVAIFFVTFVYVLLKAFQQRSVVMGNLWWIPPVSYLMAICDVFAIVSFAREGWTLGIVFAYGTAGALGSLAAIKLHKRFVK